MIETNNTPLNYQYGANFDPNAVDSERIVLLSVVIDRSGSVSSFQNDFTRALREFIEEEKKSHIAEELMVQVVTFSDDVKFETGFQPVMALDPSTIRIQADSTTAGYDAVKMALDSMLDYGKQLVGTDVRYNLCLITDGDFNDGVDRNGTSVRQILDKIRLDEQLYSKFTIFMYGVGDPSLFEKSRDNMGIIPSALLTYGANGKDFKKMLSTVSQSVSKSSSGTAVPNF